MNYFITAGTCTTGLLSAIIKLKLKVDMMVESKGSDDSTGTLPAVVSEVRSWDKNKLIRPGLIAIAIVVLLSIGVVAFWPKNNKSPQQSSNVAPTNQICSDSLLNSASTAVNKADIKSLASFQETILHLKGYDQDINCLLVLEYYGMKTNDATYVRKYLPAFTAATSDPTQHYSKALAVEKISPTQVETVAEAIVQTAQAENASQTAAQAQAKLEDQAADKAIQGQKR